MQGVVDHLTGSLNVMGEELARPLALSVFERLQDFNMLPNRLVPSRPG